MSGTMVPPRPPGGGMMPTVTAPGQMIQPPQAGSGLAQALMRAPQMPQLQAPSFGAPPLSSLQGLFKPENGNPNGQPSYGVNATPQQMGAMMNPMPNGQIPQIGQPGAPIGPPAPNPADQDAISRLWQQIRGAMGNGQQ